MPEKEQMTSIAIYVPVSLKERIVALAKADRNRKMSNWACGMLTEAVEREEAKC